MSGELFIQGVYTPRDRRRLRWARLRQRAVYAIVGLAVAGSAIAGVCSV